MCVVLWQGWTSYFFSGFVIVKLPFALTDRFKSMLQRGIFLNSLNGIGKAIGAPVGLPDLHILLPIGISFYTFNSMSYTIDVWRKRVEPTRPITSVPRTR